MILAGFNGVVESLKALVLADMPPAAGSAWDDRHFTLNDLKLKLVEFVESDERNYRKALDELQGRIDDFLEEVVEWDLDERPEWSDIIVDIETVIEQERKRGLKVT